MFTLIIPTDKEPQGSRATNSSVDMARVALLLFGEK